MKQEFTNLDAALNLAGKGYKVFTLATSHMPHEGSHGFKDATTNNDKIKSWFNKDPNSYLGLILENMLVLDIDRHNQDQDGVEALKKAGIDLVSLLQGPYRVEGTPREGFHVFMQYHGKPINQDRKTILPGVEVISHFITIAPSKGYVIARPIKFHECAEVPQNIMQLLERSLQSNNLDTGILKDTSVKYAGKIINELMKGTSEGNRNQWLTKQAGRLFWNGVDADYVRSLLSWINQTRLDVPLSKKEFESVYRSILKKELTKFGGDR